MHPIFANAGEPAIPILFVNAATFEATIADIDDREQVYVRATDYEPKPGRHLVVPKADGTLAGVLFGIEAADELVKDLFRPSALVGLLPPGSTASPMRRTTHGWRRWLSRSAPTSLPATARRSRARCGSSCPAASTATISPASSRA
jgi:hypothetical protein